MSKIQKALNALRDSQIRDSHPTTKKQDLDAAQRHHLAEKIGDRERTGNPRNVVVRPHDELVEPYVERRPGKKIALSLDHLSRDGLLAPSSDQEAIAQQFRRIKRPILQSAFEVDFTTGENANVIMVASALPGSGKSFCALNLAISIGLERDVGALIVDADVLKPGISKSLGLNECPGLIDYLVDSSIELEDIVFQTDLNDICVIPAGRKHPESTELLASRRMQKFISLLSREFRNRAIVFDTPPLLITSEAQVLAQHMGQIVFVIEARVSSQDSVIRAVGMLDRDKPINAILNKSRSANSGGYHSDDYGYYPYSGGMARGI